MIDEGDGKEFLITLNESRSLDKNVLGLVCRINLILPAVGKTANRAPAPAMVLILIIASRHKNRRCVQTFCQHEAIRG